MTSPIPPKARPMPAELYGDIFHAAPIALIVIRVDGLVMIDANDAYLDIVALPAERIFGQHVFDVFPRSDDPAAAFDLADLFQRTIEYRSPQVVEAVRYDIPFADIEGYDTRWWNVIEVPVLGEAGEVEWLLHYTEDVTNLVRARSELSRIENAKEAAARQLASLSDIALALNTATSVDDLERIVVDHGVRLLDADGGAVLSRSVDGGWTVTSNEKYDRDLDQLYLRFPHDSNYPGPVAARTGERILLPTRESGLAFDPVMAQVYTRTGRDAWAFIPLVIGGEHLGCLTISWTHEQTFDPDDLDLLDGFAAQCAQTLHRIEMAEAEHRSAMQVADMAEALQQALLTAPPEPAGMQIAVRYQTALDSTRVGGDWYDAFLQRNGATMLAIGDVAGHDSAAAGRMGQLRGIVRTLAYSAENRTPAEILTEFEATARGLQVDALATAILARIERSRHGADEGTRYVRWSNAGHPPPLMVEADGTCSVLDPKPNLLLGVDPRAHRIDHVTEFPDGATLLLYTDGLIERRTTSLDDGIDDLCHALGELAQEPVETLCDRLLDRLSPHTGEDDVAMIVLRAEPAVDETSHDAEGHDR